MKGRILSIVFFLLIFVFCLGDLFASGKNEDDAKAPVNTEWVLCITAPDISGLPPARQIIGETMSRYLVRSLSNLNFRLREQDEVEYYQDYAWMTSRASVAKALSTKRAERDLLVYRGDRPWKYRKNLRTVDAAIAKLEEDLAKIDAAAPLVEGKPNFRLVDANKNGTFPKPPAEGDEYRFCTAQKADAFVVSSLTEYHGRIYLNLKMYTLFMRSYSFEDSSLFSSDDLLSVLDEISGRIVTAISATSQAGIIVQAAPGESMVIIDGSFVGKNEVHSYPPGTVEVDVRADHYVPVSVPVELYPGELAELFVNLTPMGMAAFEANVPGKPGSRVFLGSRYMGETPLDLELPRQEYVYISVETPDGEVGSVVYRDNSLVKGRAQFTWTDNRGAADFITNLPVSAEEKRVDRARRGFYVAYGAFWFILPAALITAGYAGNTVEPGQPLFTNPLYLASHITWGAALGVTLFQAFRYLYVSGGDATPIVKASKREADNGADR